MTEFRTARNVVVVTALSLGQMLVQFLITSVWASYYRLGNESDALAAAISIPTFVTAAITGSIAYVLVPELIERFKHKNDSEGWRFASAIGAIACAASALAFLGVYFFADTIAETLFRQQNDETRQLTIQCLQILAWQPFLTGIVSWAAAVHNSRHSFIVPALAGVLGTAVSLVFIVLLGNQNIRVIAWAINIGSAVSVVVHLLPIAKHLTKPSLAGVNLLALGGAYAPLLIGTAVLRFDPVIDRVLADALSNEGATATINFAQKIMLALLALGTSTLSLIAFSQLADRHATEGLTGYREHFALVWRRLLLLVIPITIGVSVFAPEIIADLLQRREFTGEDTLAVASAFRWMIGLFLGASLGEMLARSFYVLGDTKTPTVVGIASLFAGWIIKWLLLDPLGAEGIAIGISAYYLLSATTMLGILVYRQGPKILTGAITATTRAVVASSVACAACLVVYWITILRTWGAAPVGVAVYGLVMLLLREPDVCEAARVLKQRLLPNRSQD